MPNPNVDPHVASVNLTDERVTLAVEVIGFTTGNWAEVSGYVIQNGNAFPFSAVQQVSDPDSNGISTLLVTLGPMPQLTLGNDVMVVTRVVEAQTWPTVLGFSNQPESGFKASWQAARDNPVSAAGIKFDGWQAPAQPTTAAQPPAAAGIPPLSVSVAGVQITVPPVAPG